MSDSGFPLPFKPSPSMGSAQVCACGIGSIQDVLNIEHPLHVSSCPAYRTVPPPPCMPSALGAKYDDGKPRWDLLPPRALFEIVLVLTFGANKYAPGGWRHVKGWRWRYFRALLGHVFAWWRGEPNDLESGLPHLAHAACCVMFLLELDACTPEP